MARKFEFERTYTHLPADPQQLHTPNTKPDDDFGNQLPMIATAAGLPADWINPLRKKKPM